MLEASGLAIPTRQVFPCLLLQFVLPEPGWEHLQCCGLCLHQRAEAAAKAPAPERLRALKIHSKAASNPLVFTINMTPFIRVHSSFCFLFLSLPFHCFPGASMGMAPKPRPGGRGSARSLPAAGIYSIKASSSNQEFVVVVFFFPLRFNSICI